MKIIKITTENEITTLEFPEGDITSVNKRLYEMIGPKCELMEHVMPSRLYKILGASNRPKKEKGSCTSILMDEEAYYHDLEVNVVGSWLYESDLHGNPILGNILVIGEYWGGDGVEFCGMSDEQYKRKNAMPTCAGHALRTVVKIWGLNSQNLTIWRIKR